MSAMLVDVNWPEGKLNRQFIFYPSRWTYLDRSKSCPWRRRRTCLWKKWYLWVKGFGFPPYCIQIFICCAPCLACLPGSLPDWMSHQFDGPPIADACASLRRALCDGPLLPSKATGWQNISCQKTGSLLMNYSEFGIIIPLSQDEHRQQTPPTKRSQAPPSTGPSMLSDSPSRSAGTLEEQKSQKDGIWWGTGHFTHGIP